ncbi:MAG: DNA repair protein RadC [Bacteroidia bacterium]|nr:DNA repair protein RadC [Bacteroidia bacterium]
MNENNLQIKDLADEDKPREKLLKYGASYLSDAELLAIIISSGTKGNSAIQLAQKLLAYYNNDLNKIAIQHPLNLQSTQKGLGLVKSIHIIAALELAKRRYIKEKNEIPSSFNNAETAATYFMRYLSDKIQEEFWMVALNKANLPIDFFQIGKGNYDQAIVEIREICKFAILNNSTSVIIAHNHPSGNLKPSQEDIHITKRIKEALELFNVKLLDHLILFQNQYYSFADHNLL